MNICRADGFPAVFIWCINPPVWLKPFPLAPGNSVWPVVLHVRSFIVYNLQQSLFLSSIPGLFQNVPLRRPCHVSASDTNTHKERAVGASAPQTPWMCCIPFLVICLPMREREVTLQSKTGKLLHCSKWCQLLYSSIHAHVSNMLDQSHSSVWRF